MKGKLGTEGSGYQEGRKFNTQAETLTKTDGPAVQTGGHKWKARDREILSQTRQDKDETGRWPG